MSRTRARPKVQKRSDFSEEYKDYRLRVLLHSGEVVEGRLVEARRYWIKVVTEDRKRVFYINKAYVVYIEPVLEY